MLIHTLDKTVHLLDLGKCFYVFTCTFEPECCESVDTYTKQKKKGFSPVYPHDFLNEKFVKMIHTLDKKMGSLIF